MMEPLSVEMFIMREEKVGALKVLPYATDVENEESCWYKNVDIGLLKLLDLVTTVVLSVDNPNIKELIVGTVGSAAAIAVENDESCV